MAKLTGTIKMNGSIGELSFYTTKDGTCIARRKTGLSAKRVKTDASFQRTMENSKEFARAQQGASLLRKALYPELKYIGDNRCFARLRSLMIDLVKRDTVSKRGERILTSAAFPLLTGFECSNVVAFTTAFRAPYAAVIDREEGVMQVTIPSFIPSMRIAGKQGATHAELFITGASLDFEHNEYYRTEPATVFINLSDDNPRSIVVEANLTPAMVAPLVLALGIRYYREEVPGTLVRLEDTSANAMGVVAADWR